MYFDGNQHASEVTGGETALYLAWHLLTRYGRDPDVTRLVDTRVTYVVPKADPDGAEAFITGRIDWDPATVPGARDADGDGKKGEDGPEDIDGDGQILRMRIPDPEGEWKPYERDPRIMVRRDKEDRDGRFYRVMDEGIDNDGDGKVNEDPPVTGFISNRNYPAFWASENGRYRGAGDHPLQEINARAIVEFIVSRPHIGQIESYHTTSGIHLRPYAARPDSSLPGGDMQDYAAVLAKGLEITGYPPASIYHDFTEVVPGLEPDAQPGVRRGVFIDWAYHHHGLFAVTTELWTLEPFLNEVGWDDIPRDRPLYAIPGRYNRPDVLAAFLRWLDKNKSDPALGSQGFVEWKPFHHPTLGAVEIGGFTRYILRNPPPGPYLQKVLEDQSRFAVVRGLLTPHVAVRSIHVRRLPTEPRARPIWRIEATVANEGYLDTSTEQARIIGRARPVLVTLRLPPEVSSADPVQVSIPLMRGTRGGPHVSPYSATWDVEGPEGAEVTVVVESEKGGTARRHARLKEGGSSR
jgi:hypothetical protein